MNKKCAYRLVVNGMEKEQGIEQNKTSGVRVLMEELEPFMDIPVVGATEMTSSLALTGFEHKVLRDFVKVYQDGFVLSWNNSVFMQVGVSLTEVAMYDVFPIIDNDDHTSVDLDGVFMLFGQALYRMGLREKDIPKGDK